MLLLLLLVGVAVASDEFGRGFCQGNGSSGCSVVDIHRERITVWSRGLASEGFEEEGKALLDPRGITS
jgi:hypothetical protein